MAVASLVLRVLPATAPADGSPSCSWLAVFPLLAIIHPLIAEALHNNFLFWGDINPTLALMKGTACAAARCLCSDPCHRLSLPSASHRCLQQQHVGTEHRGCSDVPSGSVIPCAESSAPALKCCF